MKSSILLLSVWGFLAAPLCAATVTMTGATNAVWTAPATWSDNLAPTSANDYTVTSLTLAAPTLANGTTATFEGKSLSVASGGISFPGSSSGTYTHTYSFPNLTAPVSVTNSTLAFSSSNATTKAVGVALAFSGANIISYASTNYGHNLNFGQPLSGSGTLTFNWTGNATNRNVNINGTANNYTGGAVLNNASGAAVFNLAQPLGAASYEVRSNWRLSNNVASGLDAATAVTVVDSASQLNLVQPWVNPAGVLTVQGGNVTFGSATAYSTTSIASMAHTGGTLQLDLGATPAIADKVMLAGNYTTTNGPIDLYLKSDPGSNTYDLVTYGGTLTGTPSVLVATSTPTRLTPVVAPGSGTNDKVSVSFTGSVANLVWKGADATNPNNWDFNTTANFDNAGSPGKFLIADNVTFDDTAASFTPNQIGTLAARAVTFNNSSNAYTVAGAGSITGAATLTKNGSSSVTLANTTANTYAGTTTINAGTLIISTAQNTTGPIVINGGKVVIANAASLGATGNKTITVNSGGQLDFNGVSPGTTRTYTYKIIGDGGDGNGALTNSSATSVGANSGIMNLELLGNATIGGAGRFDVARIGSTSGTITGNGHTLTKAGASQIQLRGDATNLPIIVNGGVLGLEDSDLAFGGASGNVTVNSGATLGAYGARTIATPVRLNAGSTLRAMGGGAANWTGAFTLGGNATLDLASQSKTISGAISETGGSFSLKKLSGNTLTLSGASSFSGGLVIDNGIVLATTNTALGTGTVTIGDTTVGGVTHQLQLRDVTIGNDIVSKYMYTGDYKGTVTAVGGFLSTVTGDITISPNITGASNRGGHIASDATAGSVLRLMGELNVAGGQTYITHRDGTVEYGGGSSSTYQLQVTNTARLAANNGIGAGVTIQLGTSNDSTLDLNGFSTTIAGLTRNASTTTVTNTAVGASVLTIDSATSTSYSGGITDGTGTVGLAKKGTGTFTLTAATSYTGNTSVEGGKLIINGATGTSPVTVAAGGTFGGVGPINGEITVNGTLAPGNTVGKLFTNSPVTFGPGSTYAWEIADWNGVTAGTEWDLLDAMDLALTATPANKLKIVISGAAANFAETAKTFEIARSASPIVGFNAAAIQIDDSAFYGNGTWTVQHNSLNNSIELVYAAGTGTPFSNWASASGIQANPALDPDGDGIANGIEFVIGGNPAPGAGSDSHALLPTITTDAQFLNFTYRRTDESAGMPVAQQPYVQYGSNLTGWNKAEAGENGITISEVNGNPDLVTVKIPRSLAGSGKLFARLRVDLE